MSTLSSSECPSPVSLPSVTKDTELFLSVSSPTIRSISLRSDLSPGGHSHGPYNDLNIVQDYHKNQMNVRIQGKRPRHAASINTLSDDVLLEIFVFCQKNHDPGRRLAALPAAVWDWHILVHVCQRWRQVVFTSPFRLNLQILCTHGTPVRNNLDIWPNVPIHIEYIAETIEGIDEDDVVAALEHPDRVSSVGLDLTGSQLRRITKMMQVSFPALRYLFLSTDISNHVPVLPSEFLGISAPCLQRIELVGIPFPALPALLLSTSDLVILHLCNIPPTGYISPDAMVAALATLTKLRSLYIGFQSPAFQQPDQIRLPPVTRTVLPALTFFEFRGVCKYLEDFVVQIYAPRLNWIFISYFNQLVDFEVPQLWRFIDHSEHLSQAKQCSIQFQHHITFGAGPITEIPKSDGMIPPHIDVRILCQEIDWQVSHIAQALNHTSTILSNMLHLAIGCNSISPEPEDMDNIEWLELLHPFSSVRTLLVSRQFAGHVSRALEDIPAVMVTDILPALDMLCLEDQPVSSIHKFIAARLESGRPVTPVDSRREFEERLMSYLN